MQTTPRVSIGMPVYNSEDFVSEAIESVLNQTFTNLELIISDNASTDRTAEICKDYAAKDSRIRYYRNATNIGASPNFNYVFTLATAEYFKWAASDDKLGAEFVQRCVEVMDSNPEIVVCYPRTTMIDQDGSITDYYADNLHLNEDKPHKRFQHFLHVSGYSNALHGLLRSDALRKTNMMGSYGTSDRNLLGELAMLGKFFEIDSYDYIKRNHARASMKLTQADDRKLAVYADPSNKGKLMLPKWRRMMEYVRAIAVIDIPFSERVRCFAILSTFLFDSRRMSLLIKDFTTTARSAISRGRRN